MGGLDPVSRQRAPISSTLRLLGSALPNQLELGSCAHSERIGYLSRIDHLYGELNANACTIDDPPLIHLFQVIFLSPSRFILRHQYPHQALPKHILPTDPWMHLIKQPLTIRHLPRPPHQLPHTPRMKFQIRRQIIYLPLPNAPRIPSFAPVMPFQRRRRYTYKLRRYVGATQECRSGRVGD